MANHEQTRQLVQAFDAKIHGICDGKIALDPLIAEYVIIGLLDCLAGLLQASHAGLNEYTEFLRLKGLGKNGKLIVDVFMENLIEERLIDAGFFRESIGPCIFHSLSSFDRQRSNPMHREWIEGNRIALWLVGCLHSRFSWSEAPLIFLGNSHALEAQICNFEEVISQTFPEFYLALNLGYQKFALARHGVPSVTIQALERGLRFSEVDSEFQRCWREYVSCISSTIGVSRQKLLDANTLEQFCLPIIEKSL